ncbi:MAG: hypothetical protein HY290_05655, partial [Planctomycetia bacterium]|nr:hypothetical protein [Planctomycetia bacterium]
MPYAAHCSQSGDTAQALDEVAGEVARQLNGAAPDPSFLFATKNYVAEVEN